MQTQIVEGAQLKDDLIHSHSDVLTYPCITMPRWQNHGQWSYVNIDCVRAPSLTLCPVLKLQELGKNATSFLLHQHDRYAILYAE